MKFETEFTRHLWDSVQPIYKQLLEHPFVIQLANGTLNQQSFAHYLAQDILYLRADAEAFEHIAKQALLREEQKFFKDLSQDCLAIEQELHTHFLAHFNVVEATTKSPVILQYTNFLIHHAKDSSYAVASAALLPCFWVYNTIGQHIFTKAVEDNPYQKWVDTYKGDAYEEFTNSFIKIVARLADEASEEEKKQMQEVFEQATLFELQFFQEAYLVK